MQLSELEFTTKGCEHIFGDSVVTPPSCTVNGKTVYTCTKCDVSAINTVEATGHTLGENGKCSSCGETCGVNVGDAYYLNLQEAINAALISSTDNTVKLFQDVDVTDTLNIGKGTATLDPNGYTINMRGSGRTLKLSNNTYFTLYGYFGRRHLYPKWYFAVVRRYCSRTDDGTETQRLLFRRLVYRK